MIGLKENFGYGLTLYRLTKKQNAGTITTTWPRKPFTDWSILKSYK